MSIIEKRTSNKVVSISANPARLTQFDPILNDPGARTTVVVRAGSTGTPTTSLRKGDTVVATRRVPVRNAGEGGIALPRRDYRPVEPA